MNLQLRDAVVTIQKEDVFAVSLMAQAVMDNRPSFRGVNVKVEGQAAYLYTECAQDVDHRPEQLTLKTSAGKTVHLTACDKEWLENILASLKN
jgi:hypothetical protein